MGSKSVQPTLGAVLRVARHRVVTREHLLALGFSAKAVKHRVARGRLFVRYPGVYAVGTPDLDSEGEWTAAVLACGDGALLSHRSAGRLWAVLRARRTDRGLGAGGPQSARAGGEGAPAG